MLIDMHAHSSGISKCCKIDYEGALREALANGMDGVILTNHYQKIYLQDYTLDELVEAYIAEYYRTRACGEELGCKVFFGIEVTLSLHSNAHMLLYGVDPEFLREYPDIFDYTQQDLYTLVHEKGGLLIHAHPFRKGGTLLDTDYMDGVEINCHPKYEGTFADEMVSIAKERGLLLTCGGDYHADTFRTRCGMEFPEDIRDHRDICRFLLSPTPKRIHAQEPDHREFLITYRT